VSYEPVNPDLRASDADREATVERLHAAAVEGRLDADELEERLSQAYAARWCSELVPLTTDVTPPAPAPEPLVFVQPQRRVNVLAVLALVAGLFWWGFIGSIAAVILGYIALGQIRRSGGRQTGRTAAILGLAFGYFGIAVLIAAILWGT
jgi:Domain of unknown function (DUF1707)/Domain of unknown function (DUF4190)